MRTGSSSPSAASLGTMKFEQTFALSVEQGLLTRRCTFTEPLAQSMYGCAAKPPDWFAAVSSAWALGRSSGQLTDPAVDSASIPLLSCEPIATNSNQLPMRLP